MNMVKKLISEFLGTMLLVLFGCGTAVAANTYVSGIYGVSLPFTMLLIALAFGLILMAIVYTLGHISGAHVNPAVSVAMAIDGRMSALECIEYIVVQILGGIAGAIIIAFLFGSYEALGANGYEAASALGSTVTPLVAFTLEAILTFVFVLVVLSVTKEKNCFSGLAIGLALTLVHIFGIPFTGTSVNPARSIGPAILTANDNGVALSQLWIFIIAPLVGGILAALFYRFVLNAKEKEKSTVKEKK